MTKRTKKKMEIALCPYCCAQWIWDWCHDCYRYKDGTLVDSEEMKSPDESDLEVVIYRCQCGEVNSVDVVGQGITSIPEWHKVDWEAKENKQFDC